MTRKYTSLTFTPSVVDRQEHYGHRASGEKMEAVAIDDEHFSITELAFLAQRDSFYMATVTEDGWPYLQHRGGPVGFVKALDAQTFGFADYRGNRQYISTGNLRASDRVALFFMDYPGRKRLKVMATAEVRDASDDPELLERLTGGDDTARVERLFLFHLVAFDWNCPQHITPRFTADEWKAMDAPSR